MGDSAIGSVLNHFYTHVAKVSPEENSEVILTSFGNSNNLSLPVYEITAINTIPTGGIFLSQNDVLQKYPYVENSSVMEFLMKIPRAINDLFKNVENKETLSIIFLGLGLICVIIPVTYLLRNNIDFGNSSKKEDKDIIK
jgi:hypothetical protein